MTSRFRGRRGFALVTVLLLMVVGTALVFGAMSYSLVDGAIARNDTMHRRAQVAAEAELWTTVSSLTASDLRLRPLGPVNAVDRTIGDIALIVTVDRVDTYVVWTVATATIRRTGMVARHRVGMTLLIPHDSSDPALHPVPLRAWAELF